MRPSLALFVGLAFLAASCGGGGGGGGGGSRSDLLYVRATEGDDANLGTSPDDAFESIARATGLATDGDTIIVGPGVYGPVDVNDRGGNESQPITIVADPTGVMTGDLPGAVIVDAAESGFGFRFTGSTFIVVDGFEIIRATGSNGAGVHVRSASGNVTVRNCVVRNNRDGFRLQNSDDVLLFNNLVINNNNNSVRIADGSDGARLVNNTIADGNNVGIRVGDNDQASTDAFLLNNVIQENRNRGILVIADSIPSSLDGYNANFNLVFSTQFGDRQVDNYRPITIIGPDDINEPAVFTGGGPDDRDAPDDYRLVQEASPAVDSGAPEVPEDLAGEVAALANRTTAPDNAPDQGPIDRGYHFPIP
jgi:parallel beta-helix repeat protein